MKLRWFLSSAVRHATDMCKHVRKLLNSQRDILAPQAVVAVTGALDAMQAAIDSGANDEAIRSQTQELEKTANKWLRTYPHAELRENIEVFLVAIVVAMGIRTFFLQPFKIPTGSMQPTLYGITTEDLHDKQEVKTPNFFGKLFDFAVKGVIYHEIIAKDDCRFVEVKPMGHILGRFFNKQEFVVEYRDQHEESFTVWLGPDENLQGCSGLAERGVFRKGEPLVRFSETTGDHLFVDRVTYNFRPPKRGEIVVFKTKGIERIPNQDQFYIKRLIGLPGETVGIGDDRHVRIDGRRLDASDPHFENVYGFKPTDPPQDSHYSGHVLDSRSMLRATDDSLPVRLRHFVVFGDNTVNSLDSRFCGDLPEENVIGKSFFVYWPITSRFGWGQR